MPLRAVCCFSHLTDIDANWQDPHFCVKKFVDALKGRQINKHAFIPVGSGPKRRLEQSNAANAIDWFGEMAAEVLENEGIGDRPILMPIPSSKCDLKVKVSKTRRLAEAVCARFDADVLDVLRFDKPQRSANGEGGTRDAEELYGHLRLLGPLTKQRPYVLIDDVVTSGGHLRAAKSFLRSRGVNVVLAIGGVSADREPSGNPFARVTREFPPFNGK